MQRGIEELMTGDIRHLTLTEIEFQCNELEDCYAEALKDHSDRYLLNTIWMRIKEMKEKMGKNNNFDCHITRSNDNNRPRNNY